MSDASTSVVLAISEHREDYPGVAVTTGTRPQYPGGSLAAHLLGYTGAVNADDLKADPSLDQADSIGRAGLQEDEGDDARDIRDSDREAEQIQCSFQDLSDVQPNVDGGTK